jgi:ubiquinone/menaquinone biosynthesis C-methylase UbiE
MSERTFDDFDEYAKEYRTIHTKNVKLSGVDSFYFSEMKVNLLGEYEKNEFLKVLDIGCGDGATELFMQKYFPQWLISGIDISENSVQIAKDRNISNTDFKVYNGTNMPFLDESFDVIFVAGVLHHVEFILHQIIIKEIMRVLKKGGRLYFFEHNPLNPLTRHLVKTCIFDKNAKLLKNDYTKKLLKQYQLKISDNNFIVFFPRKGFFSKFIFLEKYLFWVPFGGQYFIRAFKAK